ncbi:hypothetical protein OSTOST_16056, partial [Ostertagia ostertagi]
MDTLPNWVMGGYILFFIGINVVMEMLATNNEVRMEKNVSELKPHRFIVGPNGMALSHLNGPAVESPLAPPTGPLSSGSAVAAARRPWLSTTSSPPTASSSTPAYVFSRDHIFGMEEGF